jgi:hypothetical protein
MAMTFVIISVAAAFGLSEISYPVFVGGSVLIIQALMTPRK